MASKGGRVDRRAVEAGGQPHKDSEQNSEMTKSVFRAASLAAKVKRNYSRAVTDADMNGFDKPRL